jgi:phage tail-like protein
MTANIAHRLLTLLPGIYREDEFLGRYLAPFEQLIADLEAQIDGIATLFDPRTTREDFLPWLSSWMAFTLRADLSITKRRAFLAQVVSLYRRRGTRANLQELLRIFTSGEPTVEESSIANHFKVTIRLQRDTPEGQLRQSSIARALIELEKPAHTTYELELLFPSMQIGVASKVGVDTLLAPRPGA